MNRNRNLQIVDMSIMTIPSSNDCCTPPSTNWMNGETTVPTSWVPVKRDQLKFITVNLYYFDYFRFAAMNKMHK